MCERSNQTTAKWLTAASPEEEVNLMQCSNPRASKPVARMLQTYTPATANLRNLSTEKYKETYVRNFESGIRGDQRE